MDEYIDREALIAWLKRIQLIDLSDGRGLCRVIMEDDFKKAIKKMPKGITADVAPVRHGRWKPYHESDIGYDEYGVRCSNCGLEIEDHEVKFVMHYCPNCGAKMDFEEPNEAKESRQP